MDEKESRRKALEEMIQIAEEAGLYDDEITVDEHLDAVDRARELIFRREAQASTNLDGQTHVIPGHKTTIPLDYLNSLTRYQAKAQTIILQIRSILGAWENDIASTTEQKYFDQILKSLDGE